MSGVLQVQQRYGLELGEVKGQLTSVTEEAQRQVQDVTSHLQAKSGQLTEREKELAELNIRTDRELADLKQQVAEGNTEREKLQKVHSTCVWGGGRRMRKCVCVFL